MSKCPRRLRPEQAATDGRGERQTHADPQAHQPQVGGHVAVRDQGDGVKGRGEAEQRVGGIEVLWVAGVDALLCVVVEVDGCACLVVVGIFGVCHAWRRCVLYMRTRVKKLEKSDVRSSGI
jgi:hypothetical protein